MEFHLGDYIHRLHAEIFFTVPPSAQFSCRKMWPAPDAASRVHFKKTVAATWCSRSCPLSTRGTLPAPAPAASMATCWWQTEPVSQVGLWLERPPQEPSWVLSTHLLAAGPGWAGMLISQCCAMKSMLSSVPFNSSGLSSWCHNCFYWWVHYIMSSNYIVPKFSLCRTALSLLSYLYTRYVFP